MNKVLHFIIFILRICIISSLLIFVNAFEDIGSSTSMLILGAALAVFIAKKFNNQKFSNKFFILLNLALPILTYIIFYLLNLIPFKIDSNYTLNLAIIENHSFNFLGIFQISLISSYFYYKYFNYIYVEMIAGTCFFLSLLSGHRNYRFDLMNIVSDLAWYLKLEQLTTVILIGASFFIVVFVYLFLSSLPQRFKKDSEKFYSGNPIVSYSLGGTCLLCIFFFLCQSLYNFHYKEVQTKIKNGVSDEAKEGVSPLNFHSGLGGSSQATAVVRLEGDYKSNPYSPLLYFRETAVSNLIENQLVIASPDFNPDVNNTSPLSYFEQKNDFNYNYREPLNQSIFLLTDHKIAFSVDYPINIVELENKNERFKSVYRAYAMAPTFNLNDLKNIEFGNPNWNMETKEHFLKEHPDLRYKELAEKLTKNNPEKFSKIKTILNYLTKKSIYTLQPGHESELQGDPVAPYLFGDMRGYCVHFAHATTYMFRALGIPARVATGYMSDLSQSKDGHILLRMNDRHAWAEAYIKNLGWIVFDIQPEQVESHAETPVDADLLEELIDMIDPGQELIPEDAGKDEVGLKDKAIDYNISKSFLLYFIIIAFLLILLINSILLNLYKLVGNKERKLKLFYTVNLLKLQAFNKKREDGQSFKSFLSQVSNKSFDDIDVLDKIYFNPNYKLESINSIELDKLIKNENKKFKDTIKAIQKNSFIKFIKLFFMYINPSTSIKILKRKV